MIWFDKFGICISLSNPFKNLHKVKKVFKTNLKSYVYFGITKCVPLFYFNSVSPIVIESHDVTWKDKYDTPRFEEFPFFHIKIFKYSFVILWKINFDMDDNDYWEQVLWYLYYYNTYSQGLLDKPNIEKAKESWPWTDMNDKSTWQNKCLL